MRIGKCRLFHADAIETPTRVIVEECRLPRGLGRRQTVFEFTQGAYPLENGLFRGGACTFPAASPTHGNAAPAQRHRQGIQDIAISGEPPEQRQHPPDEQEGADAFPEITPAARTLGQILSRPQVNTGDDEQRRPQEQHRHFRQEAEEVDGDRQQQHAEDLFDPVHPRAGPGQQETGADTDGDQDHPHPERHGEHDGAAKHRVAVGDGHAQRGDKERGDARPDNQG